MNNLTTIDETNTIISNRDASVRGFKLNDNKKVFYLPLAIAEHFPNLQGIQADSCAIKGIAKENFNGLSKLKALYLQFNQIEMITTESFSDLVELEILDLRNENFTFIVLLF